MNAVFRWAIWGDKPLLFEMLPYSINSFRRAFGAEARYIVVTDRPGDVRSILPQSTEIVSYTSADSCMFDARTSATWKKWCPTARLVPACAEFNVDADVFLLGEPAEIKRFAQNRDGRRFMIMQEAPGTGYYVGWFGPRILRGIPPVNTGLFGQRAGVDITDELMSEFQWWLNNVPHDRRRFHDDQGAITTILARWYLLDQTELLPQDKYRIVTSAATPDPGALDGISAIHAASKKHPAYFAFKDQIIKYLDGFTSTHTRTD